MFLLCDPPNVDSEKLSRQSQRPRIWQRCGWSGLLAHRRVWL